MRVPGTPHSFATRRLSGIRASPASGRIPRRYTVEAGCSLTEIRRWDRLTPTLKFAYLVEIIHYSSRGFHGARKYL
jgi:hypothetical protein